MTFNPFLPDKAAAAPTGPLTLATVGAVSEEGVTLILPGATEPTQAHYPNFSSSSLASGDSVIISRVSGTWVVMGKAGGGGGGGGGTSNYNDLSNKPSINGNTLSGNKTAAQLGLGTYSKPSGGIPASDLASAVLSPYRTAAAQDAIDAAQDAEIVASSKADEIGIVITGKRPSMTVTSGQYVIVRGSTISGITDGLYTANVALSPSTDVTAANLMATSNGGLNSLKSELEANIIKSVRVSLGDLPSLTPQVLTGTLDTPLSAAPSVYWLGKVNTSANGGGLIIKIESFTTTTLRFVAYNPRSGETKGIIPTVYYIE